MGYLLLGTPTWAAHSESWNSKRKLKNSARFAAVESWCHWKLFSQPAPQTCAHTPSHTTRAWRANHTHESNAQNYKNIPICQFAFKVQLLASAYLFFPTSAVLHRKIQTLVGGVALVPWLSLRKEKKAKKRSLKRTQQRSFVFFLHLGGWNGPKTWLLTWLVLQKKQHNF